MNQRSPSTAELAGVLLLTTASCQLGEYAPLGRLDRGKKDASVLRVDAGSSAGNVASAVPGSSFDSGDRLDAASMDDAGDWPRAGLDAGEVADSGMCSGENCLVDSGRCTGPLCRDIGDASDSGFGGDTGVTRGGCREPLAGCAADEICSDAGVCLNNDASLSALRVSGASLFPEFSPSGNAYIATVPTFAKNATLSVAAASPHSSLKVNGEPVQNGDHALELPYTLAPLSVDVVAASGAVRRYTVTLQRTSGTYIKAHNPGAEDRFGQTFALDGDTLVVGAPYEDGSRGGDGSDDKLIDSGAVYVFVRTGQGDWVRQAYLKADNADAGDIFGAHVAVQGDLIAVSALNEASAQGGTAKTGSLDNSAPNAGAVYLFKRSAGEWNQEAYLKPRHPDAEDWFGVVLRFDQNRLAVSATWEDSAGIGANSDTQADNSLPTSGAAYLFSNLDGEWTQTAYFKSTNPGNNDRFGSAMALQGNTLVVSAYIEDGDGTSPLNDSAIDSGAVYVFVEEDGVWSDQAYLKASNAKAYDFFGLALDLDGDVLAVGAPYEDGNGMASSGAVYTFTRQQGVWSEQAYLKADNSNAEDRFGSSVQLESGLLLVAAPWEGSDSKGINGPYNHAARRSGAIFAFRASESGWVHDTYLKAPNTGAEDELSRVDLSGTTVAGGALLEDGSGPGINASNNDDLKNSGAVYVW